jgi:hypothetical protein
VAIVEQMPDLEGRTMLMVLGPNPKRIKKDPVPVKKPDDAAADGPAPAAPPEEA